MPLYRRNGDGPSVDVIKTAFDTMERLLDDNSGGTPQFKSDVIFFSRVLDRATDLQPFFLTQAGY
jgi:hypothetical protein